ncbi:hypothetical protein V0M98_34845 (plasmid) [Pseudomonas silesiensis]|uniref:hypothetical protein n=1 Tax=Pseudomonas silesiensis TaxID=1853130 RepID=UPI0030CB5BD0
MLAAIAGRHANEIEIYQQILKPALFCLLPTKLVGITAEGGFMKANFFYRSGLVAASLIAMSSAYAQCPSGFVNVGEAFATDNKDFAEAKVPAKAVLVKFPPNIVIDKSYVQHGGKWSGGSAGAVMTDAGVPNGLMIIASGSEGGAKGWAVHKPVLQVLQESDDGRIIQRGYEMKLYCHTGSGEQDKIGHQSCQVRAEFCAKIKSI